MVAGVIDDGVGSVAYGCERQIPVHIFRAERARLGSENKPWQRSPIVRVARQTARQFDKHKAKLESDMQSSLRRALCGELCKDGRCEAQTSTSVSRYGGNLTESEFKQRTVLWWTQRYATVRVRR